VRFWRVGLALGDRWQRGHNGEAGVWRWLERWPARVGAPAAGTGQYRTGQSCTCAAHRVASAAGCLEAYCNGGVARGWVTFPELEDSVLERVVARGVGVAARV
jgi:hypothetical protein